MSNDSCYGSDLNDDEDKLSALLEPCSSDDDANVEHPAPNAAQPPAAGAPALRSPPVADVRAEGYLRRRPHSSGVFDLSGFREAVESSEEPVHIPSRRVEYDGARPDRKSRRALAGPRSRSFISRNDSFRFAVHGDAASRRGRATLEVPNNDDEVDTFASYSVDGSERSSQLQVSAYCDCDACQQQQMQAPARVLPPEAFFEHDSGLEQSADRRLDPVHLFTRDEAISCSTPLPHLSFLESNKTTVDNLVNLDVVRAGSYPLPVINDVGHPQKPFPRSGFEASRNLDCSGNFATSTLKNIDRMSLQDTCEDDKPPEVPQRGVRFRDRAWELRAQAGNGSNDTVAPAREGSPSMRHDVMAAPRLSLFGSGGSLDKTVSCNCRGVTHTCHSTDDACLSSCSKCDVSDVTPDRHSHLLRQPQNTKPHCRHEESRGEHWFQGEEHSALMPAPELGESSDFEGHQGDLSSGSRSCLGCMMLRQYNFGKGTVFGIFAKPANSYLTQPQLQRPHHAHQHHPAESYHSPQSSTASASAPPLWRSPRLKHLKYRSPQDSFSSDCTLDSTWTNDDLSSNKLTTFNAPSRSYEAPTSTVATQRTGRRVRDRNRLMRVGRKLEQV